MDGLTVIIKKQPQKYLDKLPEPERGRVAGAVAKLSYVPVENLSLPGSFSDRHGQRARYCKRDQHARRHILKQNQEPNKEAEEAT